MQSVNRVIDSSLQSSDMFLEQLDLVSDVWEINANQSKIVLQHILIRHWYVKLIFLLL